jgi:hypothetical protein
LSVPCCEYLVRANLLLTARACALSMYATSPILLLPGTSAYLCPGRVGPGGSARHNGALRPLARAGSTGTVTLPTDSQVVSRPSTRATTRAGHRPGRFRALRRRPLQEASWGDRRRGPSSVWCRPSFSPAFPRPTHNEGPASSGGVLSRRSGSCRFLRPAGPAGRLSASVRSETWPCGFA